MTIVFTKWHVLYFGIVHCASDMLAPTQFCKFWKFFTIPSQILCAIFTDSA